MFGFNLDDPQIVQRLTWYSLNSLKFNKVNESVILCPLRGIVTAGFGLIVDIFSHEGKAIFVCKMMRTIKFNSHFQTFVVTVREEKLCSPDDEMLFKKPFYLAVSQSSLVSYQIFTLHTPCHRRPVADTFHITTKSELSKLVLRQQHEYLP